MIALTTRQRDLLQLLLETDAPLATADIAKQMQLTARQVNYSLKGIENWLKANGHSLSIKPGIGIIVDSSASAREELLHTLFADSNFQLILSASQRQQLIILKLLLATEPLILYNLQQLAGVSRTTILKDLEQAELWLNDRSFALERRPNYGLWLTGSEEAYRQAFAMLLWGEDSFEESLWQVSFDGLHFQLSEDVHLLDQIEMAQAFTTEVQMGAGMAHVAFAEADMGGRFTDNAVLHLALVLAVQSQRIRSGQLLSTLPNELDWLKAHPVWETAEKILRTIHMPTDSSIRSAETARIALQILASPKNSRWQGDLDNEQYAMLVADLMQHIGITYELPHLSQDTTLRDGLVALIVPACLRAEFDLWSPKRNINGLDREKYADEYEIAEEIADRVKEETNVSLKQDEINDLALLLRAAYIRERPQQTREVIVVCPSGMATAQLLVARLKARFPHLGDLKVVSVRELSPSATAEVDLILTTVPLNSVETEADIIQVHPLLLPEDVAAITQWLV